MRRTVYRLMQLVAVVLLGVMLWGGWYLSNRGFTRKWRKELVKEFRNRGVEVSFRRLTLDPLRGLVARDVRIVDENARDQVLATISSITLDINYANLIQGESFLNGIDLRQAHLSLPLVGGQRLEVTNLDAKVVFAPQQIHLRHAEAKLYGIRLRAGGRLINPEALRGGGERPRQLDIPWLPALVECLGKLRSEAEPPELLVNFSGDLGDASSFYAEATLSSRSFGYGEFNGRNLFGKARYRQGSIELNGLRVEDGRGRLEMGGVHELATGETKLQLRSSLDLQRLGIGWLEGLSFESLPLVDVSANGSLKTGGLQLLGQLALGRFAFGAVAYKGLSAGFSWRGGDWYLSDVQLAHESGSLKADLLQRAGGWRAKLESTLSPEAFAPLLPREAVRWLERSSFQEGTTLKLNAEGKGWQPLSGGGEFATGRGLLCGMPVRGVSSKLLFEPGKLVFDNLRIARGEGAATGRLRYDFETKQLQLSGLESRLWPGDVAAAIDPRLARALGPFRFREPPRLLLEGKIPMDAPEKAQLEINVAAPALDFALRNKGFPATAVAARLFYKEGALKISDLKADLFGGKLLADVGVRRQGYSARLQMQGVDFAKLTNQLFEYSVSGGKLSGEWDLSGKGRERLRGGGRLELVDGDVFAIPLFGPLSGVFESVLPGAGYRKAQKGAVAFRIEDGIVTTSDLLVEGLGFAMIGQGRVDLPEERIDFDVRLNARGAPGMVLFPVSKLFEFKGEGSFSRPKWRPKHLPGN